MSQMSQKELRDQVLRYVEEAFSNVKYEHFTFHQKPTWQLQGKHWREVPIDMLKRDGFIFSLPLIEDGRFFLPSYIVAVLKNQKEMEEYVVSLLLILAPEQNADAEKESPTLSAYLNNKQKLAVLAFLEACPKLFPEHFSITTFPDEVNEFLSELNSNLDLKLPPPRTLYQLLNEAVTYWQRELENHQE
jgi:hypothetical protein